MRKKDSAQTCHPQEGQRAPCIQATQQDIETSQLLGKICPRDERFLRHLKKRSPLKKRNKLKMTEYQARNGKYKTLRIDHANL